MASENSSEPVSTNQAEEPVFVNVEEARIDLLCAALDRIHDYRRSRAATSVPAWRVEVKP